MMLKLKYRVGIIKYARKASLMTEFIHVCRLKCIHSDGKFLKGDNYLKTIQAAFTNPETGKSAQLSTISKMMQDLVKAKFAKPLYDAHNNAIGYQLVSYYNIWLEIEGKMRDKRHTRNNLKGQELNKIENSTVLFFRTVPTKQEILLQFQAIDLSRLIINATQKNQITDNDNGSSNVPAFQKDSSGGFIISLSRLKKSFGLKGNNSMYRIVSLLTKQHYIVKNKRTVAYSESECEELWQEYCYFKYQKFTSAVDWMEDTKWIVEPAIEPEVEQIKVPIEPITGKTTSYQDYLALFQKSAVVPRSTEIKPGSAQEYYTHIHTILTKNLDDQPLTLEEQDRFEEFNFHNALTPPSSTKAVFLDDQEFDEFSKTKASGKFSSEFLKSRAKHSDSRGSKRIVFVNKQPHRVLANEYFLHQSSPCKLIKSYKHDFSTGQSIPQFYSTPNVQKSSLTIPYALQEENLQSSITTIVIK